MSAPGAAGARAILAAHDPAAEFRGVSRAGNGYSGRTFFLRTDRADLVLTCSAEPATDWRLRKQVALFDHLRAIGLPAPAILAIDVDRAAVPFGYTLAGRLPGTTLTEALPSMPLAARQGIYGALGDALGRIHGTVFDRFGDIVAGPDGLVVGPVFEAVTIRGAPPPGPFASWGELHAVLVDARLRLLADSPFADIVEPARAWFARHAGPIDVPVTPRLLHMDLHGGNVLVDGDRITGIIDVDEAIVGHDEYDLMRTELAHFRGQDPAHAAAFLAAYRRHIPEDEGYASRRRVYDASRTLVWMLSLIGAARAGSRVVPDDERMVARAHLVGLLRASG